MTDSKEAELKPCPFCGGAAQDNDGGNSIYGRFWWSVGCVDCEVVLHDREEWHDRSGPKAGRLKYEAKECFDRWNRRSATPPQDTVRELVEVIQDARRSVNNARSAIETNQVVDKDVHGTLMNLRGRLDAALSRAREGTS